MAVHNRLFADEGAVVSISVYEGRDVTAIPGIHLCVQSGLDATFRIGGKEKGCQQQRRTDKRKLHELIMLNGA
jgi:hypothetical protein